MDVNEHTTIRLFFISPSICVISVTVQSDDVWLISFTGAAGTLYAGETYTLRIRFTSDYPMDSPECVFLLPAPVHTHIYSNGHICLNILVR